MNKKLPFEARLLLITCLALIVVACGSGDIDSTQDKAADVVINPEETQISEYPVAYITRDQEIHDDNFLVLDSFSPGASLFVRESVNADALEVNLTERIFGSDARYDVRDIKTSYDGKYMMFAARGPFDDSIDPESDQQQPAVWNLYVLPFGSWKACLFPW